MYGITETERSTISQLFNTGRIEHERIFTPIMSWILQWKICCCNCCLDNLITNDLYKIEDGKVILNENIKSNYDIGIYIHHKCKIDMVNEDITKYEKEICKNGSIRKYIRGKYLRAFFVKFVISVVALIPKVMSRQRLKPYVPLGYKNAIHILCGYMRIPATLDRFLRYHFL
jgi:hypothetical protein